MAKIGEAIIDFRTQLVNFKKGVGEAKTTLGKFGGFVRKNSEGLRTAGLALTAFTAGMVALGTKGVLSASKFQSQLQNVATMLDDTTMKFMPEYKTALMDLAKKYGESTETLSKGLYDILSASVDAGDALKVLEVSAKMARAGLTDTGVAADALTTLINAYGLEAEKASDISDLLFAVVKRGKTTMAELAPSIGVVATTASVAGLSLEEMGAMLASMTRSGISTDMAVTSLNAVMTGLLKPTKQAKDAFREVTTELGLHGIELNTTTLKQKGLIGMTEILSKANDEQLASIFPNVRAFRGLAVALNDTEGYQKDLEIMMNRSGLTMKAYKKQTSTLVFVFDQFSQKIEMIFVQFGDKLLPIVTKVIKVFSGLLDIIGNLSSSTAIAIVVFGGFVTILIGLAGPALLVAGNFASITKAVVALVPMLAKLKLSFAGLGIIGLVSALGLAINALADYAIAQKDASNANINTRKSIQDLIKGHREEIKEINKVLEADKKVRMLQGNSIKDLWQIQTSLFSKHKLSIKEREKLEKKLVRTVKALKKQEERLAKQVEDAKLAKAREVQAMQAEENAIRDEEKRALEQAYYDWNLELGNISLEDHKLHLEEKLASTTENTLAHLELEKQLHETKEKIRLQEEAADEKTKQDKLKRFNETINNIQNTTNAYGNFLSEFSSYQQTLINNDLQESLDSEQQKYNDKKKWIEANITDEDEKTKKLEALDRSYENTKDNLRSRADKKLAAQRKKMKPYLIAQAIANTALGATKALGQGGFFGIILAALVIAAGALQIAKIKAQKFAEGGIVGGNKFSGDNIIAGLNSGEMVLNKGQQKKLFDIANGSETTNVSNKSMINVDLRGAVISSKKAYKEFENTLYRVLKNNRKIATV